MAATADNDVQAWLDNVLMSLSAMGREMRDEYTPDGKTPRRYRCAVCGALRPDEPHRPHSAIPKRFYPKR